MHYPSEAIAKAARVKLVIFDVDGVLTDGSITYTSDGSEIKSFNVQDGAALKMLMNSGVQCAIITGRSSPMVTRRANELGISHLYQGVDDKSIALEQLCKACNITPHDMAHMGDDIPDLILFNRVGFAISVPSSHPAVAARADYVSEAMPGRGAVREVCHLIMTAQETWQQQLAVYE